MFLHCVHFSLLRFELYFWARASLETKSRQIKQQLRCRFYGATVQQQSFFSSSSSSFSIAQCSDRVLFSFLYPTAHIHCSLHCSLPTLWHLCKKRQTHCSFPLTAVISSSLLWLQITYIIYFVFIFQNILKVVSFVCLLDEFLNSKLIAF